MATRKQSEQSEQSVAMVSESSDAPVQAVLSLTYVGKADSELDTAAAAVYSSAHRAGVVDLVARQLELQRSMDWVADLIDEDLPFISVKAKPITENPDGTKSAKWYHLVKPEGRVVVNIDDAPRRKDGAFMGGNFASSSYKVDGEVWGSINVNAYGMDREPVEIVASLGEQYLLLVAEATGVVLTSRQGRYRNQAFESVARRLRVLDVFSDKTNGCVTQASDFLRRECAETLRPDFGDIVKLAPPAPKARSTSAGSSVTLICECSTHARVRVSLQEYADGFRPWCLGWDPSEEAKQRDPSLKSTHHRTAPVMMVPENELEDRGPEAAMADIDVDDDGYPDGGARTLERLDVYEE